MSIDQWLPLLVLQAAQVTVVALAAAAVARLVARQRPRLAHALWAVVLLKCVTPPLWSSPCGVLSWLPWPASQHSAATPSTPELDVVAMESSRRVQASRVGLAEREASSQSASESEASWQAPLPWQASDSPPAAARSAAITTPSLRIGHRGWDWGWGWLARVWLVGAALGLVITVARLVLFLRLVRRHAAPTSAEVDAALQSALDKVRPGRRVQVLVVNRNIGPAVLGAWRPTILLPAFLVEGRGAGEIEPLLAHELMHVRRGDLWWSMLQCLAVSLHWYHPLIHWVAARLTGASERLCDQETVARLGCQPAAYARCLLEVLERKRSLRVAPALPGVRPVEITARRMEAIMRLGNGMPKERGVVSWLVLLAGCAVALPGASFVSAQRPGAQALASPPSRPLKLEARSYEVGDLLVPAARSPHATQLDGDQLVHLLGLKTELQPTEAARVLEADAEAAHRQWGAASVEGGRLTVLATPAKHRELKRQLELFRRHGFAEVRLRSRMLRMPADLLAKLNIDWRLPPQQGPAVPMEKLVLDPTIAPSQLVLNRVLTANQMQAIVALAERQEGVKLTEMPVVRTWVGQAANVSDVVMRPFVVSLAAEESGKPEPVINVVKEGWTLNLLPTLKTGRASIAGDPREARWTRTTTNRGGRAAGQIELKCDVIESSIEKVDTFTFQLRPNSVATVQVPEVRSRFWSVTAKLDSGETLAVGSHGIDGEAVVLLIDAELLAPGDRSLPSETTGASHRKIPGEWRETPTPQPDVYRPRTGNEPPRPAAKDHSGADAQTPDLPRVMPSSQGQVLPSPYYLRDDVQYFPPIPALTVSPPAAENDRKANAKPHVHAPAAEPNNAKDGAEGAAQAEQWLLRAAGDDRPANELAPLVLALKELSLRCELRGGLQFEIDDREIRIRGDRLQFQGHELQIAARRGEVRIARAKPGKKAELQLLGLTLDGDARMSLGESMRVAADQVSYSAESDRLELRGKAQLEDDDYRFTADSICFAFEPAIVECDRHVTFVDISKDGLRVEAERLWFDAKARSVRVDNGKADFRLPR
ncbi:MAG: M56 family metallopeptidase [Planctomycetales bacterium]|nr:M56 family metallopeptidase [Planctomycetales bacterium]